MHEPAEVVTPHHLRLFDVPHFQGFVKAKSRGFLPNGVGVAPRRRGQQAVAAGQENRVDEKVSLGDGDLLLAWLERFEYQNALVVLAVREQRAVAVPRGGGEDVAGSVFDDRNRLLHPQPPQHAIVEVVGSAKLLTVRGITYFSALQASQDVARHFVF